MDATCSMIPQTKIILQGNCFKEMFLLMHKKSTKSCRILELHTKSDPLKTFGLQPERKLLHTEAYGTSLWNNT